MSQRLLIKIITILVFVVVIGTPLFYQKTGIFPYTLGKSLFFQAIVELVFAFWLVLAVSNREYRPKKTPLTLAVGVFLAVLLVTSFLGEDHHRSFWSMYERGFGVFTMLHLGAFALVLSSLGKRLPWKNIFYASLATALIVGVLAVLQLNIKNLLLEEPTPGRPGATFGNPSFLAGYLLFNIFLAAYFVLGKIKDKISFKGKEAVAYIFLSTVFVLSISVLFLTQTRGDILGFAVAIFILLLMFLWKPPELGIKFLAGRKLWAALVVFIIIFSGFFWLTKENLFWRAVPGLNRFAFISLESESLQPRIIAAKAAWHGFLDNPVLGVGWDNFNIIFNKYYDPQALRLGYQETRFDKPHNFILEDMVSGGLPLVLAHLAVFALFFWQSFKLRDRLLGQIVVAAVGGYFVRNLFIFDTVGPTLMLYLFFGYVDWNYKNDSHNNASETDKNGDDGVVAFLPFAAVAVTAMIFIYVVNINSLRASNYHFRGFVDMARGRVEKSIQNFKSALDIWSPYRWNFVRDYAAVMAETYFYNPDIISSDEVLAGVREMERVARDHPKDAFNHYFLVDLYNQTSDLDPTFLDKAEREAFLALKLSPDRQQILFSLAKTKTLQGDYETAVSLAKRALALDEEVADSHFYYGLLSFVQGDQETGYQELKIAVQMGKRFRNYNEPLTIANFFADYGKISEAVEFYQMAHDMRPDDPEVQIKAGVAYLLLGRRDDAKTFLEMAGRKFDFRQSPAFTDLKPILDDLGIAY